MARRKLSATDAQTAAAWLAVLAAIVLRSDR
jgi:hypothetical protein